MSKTGHNYEQDLKSIARIDDISLEDKERFIIAYILHANSKISSEEGKKELNKAINKAFDKTIFAKSNDLLSHYVKNYTYEKYEYIIQHEYYIEKTKGLLGSSNQFVNKFKSFEKKQESSQLNEKAFREEVANLLGKVTNATERDAIIQEVAGKIGPDGRKRLDDMCQKCKINLNSQNLISTATYLGDIPFIGPMFRLFSRPINYFRPLKENLPLPKGQDHNILGQNVMTSIPPSLEITKFKAKQSHDKQEEIDSLNHPIPAYKHAVNIDTILAQHKQYQSVKAVPKSQPKDKSSPLDPKYELGKIASNYRKSEEDRAKSGVLLYDPEQVERAGAKKTNKSKVKTGGLVQKLKKVFGKNTKKLAEKRDSQSNTLENNLSN